MAVVMTTTTTVMMTKVVTTNVVTTTTVVDGGGGDDDDDGGDDEGTKVVTTINPLFTAEIILTSRSRVWSLRSDNSAGDAFASGGLRRQALPPSRGGVLAVKTAGTAALLPSLPLSYSISAIPEIGGRIDATSAVGSPPP
jgi:hypothetical protein